MKTVKLICALVIYLAVAGCGEHASRSATQGAASGAASGAVGGLVSALIFGGDPVEAAARGAVYGGSVGATAGAISGGQVDAKIAAQRQAEEEQIRKEVGDDAFKGLGALVDCRYQQSFDYAEKAKQSNNPNYAVSGYWLELLTLADGGGQGSVNELLAVVVEKDWETDSEAQAQTLLQSLSNELKAARSEYKRAPDCS